MAYKTNELIKKCLKVIEERKLLFIEQVCVYVGISKQCFYDHKLDENDEIKEAILNNKIRIKHNMQHKFYMSDNPTLQLAFYKLIGTKEERQKLCQIYQDLDITSKGNKIEGINYIVPNNGTNDKTDK